MKYGKIKKGAIVKYSIAARRELGANTDEALHKVDEVRKYKNGTECALLDDGSWCDVYWLERDRTSLMDGIVSWTLVVLFWSAVVYLMFSLPSCNEPETTEPDTRATCVFTSKMRPQPPCRFMHIYTMWGPLHPVLNGYGEMEDTRTKCVVYSNSNFALNKEYLMPLSKLDSLVK